MSSLEGENLDSDDSLDIPLSQAQDKNAQSSSAKDAIMLDGVNRVLFNKEFYQIVEQRISTPYERKMAGIIAVCQTCFKKIKGSLKVSSNFIHHLRQNHPTVFENFKKQRVVSRAKKFKHVHFHANVLDYICESASPLSTVEHPSFKKLFPDKPLPSRRTITRLLDENHNVCTNKIVEKLNKIKYVCTTADIWSGGKRSFLGVTCHWLDVDSLSRHSAALACRRFKGTHSFDKLAELLKKIYLQYKLQTNKIVYTITDNGTNFIKAFKEFVVALEEDNVEDESVDDSENDECDEEEQPEFHSINNSLSKRFPCSSHTLNLLASADFLKILKSSENKEAYERHTSAFKR